MPDSDKLNAGTWASSRDEVDMKRMMTLGLCVLMLNLGSGCHRQPEGFRPINPDAAVFWSRQITESAALLRAMADDFNATWDGLPVKVEQTGNYGEIFRKVSASIRARTLPAMAVAYESMTAEYIDAGAVASLDVYVNDAEVGLTAEDLADFFPAVLDMNRFQEHGGAMYSFPFAKSVLMLYYNLRVLRAAGIEAPPATWDAFLDQCRKVTAHTGAPAYALNVDCSTIDGMIFSMGGEVIQGRETRYDSPEALRVFSLIETLAREKLAYQVSPGTYDDQVALANDQVAFILRSSSGRENMRTIMEDDDAWGMAPIPQADPGHPATVLYGPNICIFSTTPEQEKTAWAFIKYFTSPESVVRWSLGTGYLPIRKSAADHPDMKASWAAWRHNRAAFDCLAYAKAEPNVKGWQQVRDEVARVETEILNGLKTASEGSADLKKAADRILAGR